MTGGGGSVIGMSERIKEKKRTFLKRKFFFFNWRSLEVFLQIFLTDCSGDYMQYGAIYEVSQNSMNRGSQILSFLATGVLSCI